MSETPEDIQKSAHADFSHVLAMLPKLHAMHAEQSARSMARLIEAVENPADPTKALENLVHEAKMTLCLDGLSHIPATLTLQSHVLDILFNHLLGEALDGQSKQALLQIALRSQKQCRDIMKDLARLQRDEVKMQKPPKKSSKNGQADYYEEGFYR